MPAWCSIATRHEMRRTFAASLTGLAVLVLTGLPALAQLPAASDNTLGENNQRVLPIAEAFPWYVSEAEPGQFHVVFNPAPEHYLYRHAFGFRLRTGDEEAQIEFRLPPGLEKTDQFSATSSRITNTWRPNSISAGTFRPAPCCLSNSRAAPIGVFATLPNRRNSNFLPLIFERTAIRLIFCENAPKFM